MTIEDLTKKREERIANKAEAEKQNRAAHEAFENSRMAMLSCDAAIRQLDELIADEKKRLEVRPDDEAK